MDLKMKIEQEVKTKNKEKCEDKGNITLDGINLDTLSLESNAETGLILKIMTTMATN